MSRTDLEFRLEGYMYVAGDNRWTLETAEREESGKKESGMEWKQEIDVVP